MTGNASNSETTTVTYRVPDNIGKIRLDKLIGQNAVLHISRSRLQKLIDAGAPWMNGQPLK